MPDRAPIFKDWHLHLAIIAMGLALDQLTKWWAVREFSLASGDINYHHVLSVAGEWVQLRLVYNKGAAFGMQPQALFSFIHPTLFYGLISATALVVLFFFYRQVPAGDRWTRIGLSLIVSGAFGNIADRLRLHQVVDFIDAGIPGFSPRWPTFNVADSMVCIGVSLVLILPLFQKRAAKQAVTSPPPQTGARP